MTCFSKTTTVDQLRFSSMFFLRTIKRPEHHTLINSVSDNNDYKWLQGERVGGRGRVKGGGGWHRCVHSPSNPPCRFRGRRRCSGCCSLSGRWSEGRWGSRSSLAGRWRWWCPPWSLLWAPLPFMKWGERVILQTREKTGSKRKKKKNSGSSERT